MHVLIVEDDAGIAGALLDFLIARGHAADWAASPAQALARLEQATFDVLVLDRGLPRMEGLRFLRLLREELHHDLPVLVLTARDSESDKLEGFRAGADDYVVKPFSLAEVEARLLALARRGGVGRGPARRVLEVGALRFDPDRFELSVGGEVRSGGPKVLQMIEILMRDPGRVFTHSELEQALWGEAQDNSDKLRQVLYQARKLLDGGAGCDITTVHGRGYRLERRA